MPHEPVEWRLGPWPAERAWQREFLSRVEQPVATVVVGTSHPQKDWLPERWAEVVDALHYDFGLQPVLAGGRSPREVEAERLIVQRARHRPLSTLGVPLRQLVAVLDASALVLSPDTAPLHMAVALDRPVISLMGYNNPKRVGPYRKFHDLIVDAYGDPGEDYPVSLEHRSDRMPRIAVRDVLEKVERWRERYSREPGAGSGA